MTEKTPKMLMRFTRLEDLFHMFEWGGIPLYDASRWDDQVDQAMMKRGCRELSASRYGVISFLEPIKWSSKHNSDVWETYAHWKIYANGGSIARPEDAGTLGICLKFDFSKLETMVNNLKGAGFLHLGKVEYKPFGEFRKSDGLSPCDWFFRKRPEYFFENEYRVIILDQQMNTPSKKLAFFNGASAFIPFNWKKNENDVDWNRKGFVISDVTFSPFCTSPSFPKHAPDTACLREWVLFCREYREKQMGKKWSESAVKAFEELISACSHRAGLIDNKDVLQIVNKDVAESIDSAAHKICSKCVRNSNECPFSRSFERGKSSAKKRAATTKGKRK